MKHDEQREFDALKEVAAIINDDPTFAEVIRKYFAGKSADEIKEWAQEFVRR